MGSHLQVLRSWWEHTFGGYHLPPPPQSITFDLLYFSMANHYVENAPIELSAAPRVDPDPLLWEPLSCLAFPREATLYWFLAGVQELPTSLPRAWTLSCGPQKISLLCLHMKVLWIRIVKSSCFFLALHGVMCLVLFWFPRLLLLQLLNISSLPMRPYSSITNTC